MGGEVNDRGWDGWMASLTWWTWVCVTPGVGDEQGGLACCSAWGCKELDMTEQMNWIEMKYIYWLRSYLDLEENKEGISGKGKLKGKNKYEEIGCEEVKKEDGGRRNWS